MRSKILESARDTMIRMGYQDFHMGDVAKKAGLASGTLYLYFKDIVSLFAGVFMDLLDQLDGRLLKIIQKKSGLDSLGEMAEEPQTGFARHNKIS